MIVERDVSTAGSVFVKLKNQMQIAAKRYANRWTERWHVRKSDMLLNTFSRRHRNQSISPVSSQGSGRSFWRHQNSSPDELQSNTRLLLLFGIRGKNVEHKLAHSVVDCYPSSSDILHGFVISNFHSPTSNRRAVLLGAYYLSTFSSGFGATTENWCGGDDRNMAKVSLIHERLFFWDLIEDYGERI